MKRIIKFVILICLVSFSNISCQKEKPKPVEKKPENTGFTINMSRMERSFKRAERMEMIKDLPAKERMKYMKKWGYLD